MTTPVPPLTHLLRQLAPEGNSVPDAELLRRYADHRDEAAFELLLWRHGGMVWGVCRRVAPDHGAAEDAFQATALALARHAGAVRAARSVAGWLYRVAYRAAFAVRSRRREEAVARIPDRPAPGPDPAETAAARDLAGVIDAELNRLPDTFRLPFVLCELEGRSNAEAAALLGCPVGTVESRLTRARARLRDRLFRRGVTLSLGAFAAVQIPGSVHAAAVRAASDPAAAPAPVRELAARAAGAGWSGHLRAAGLVLAGLTALAVGLAVATGSRPASTPPEARDREPVKPAADGPARPVVFARLGSARFRHPGPVFHAAFSPGGKRLATAALGCVSVWETATGKLLRRLERGNVPFHRVAFTADGKTLYSVVGPTQEGCELLTLDPTTLQERGRVVIHKRIYKGAEFSPVATRLALFPMWVSGEVVLVDPATGKELAGVRAFWRGNGFTPDGKRLVLAGGEEEVRVVDATTAKQVGKLKPGDRRPEWVRFAPGGAALLAGPNWVERWDPKRSAPVWRVDLLPSGRGLEVSPDGARVAHVSPYGITVIDVETGKQAFRAHSEAYTAARFSPDGRTLALTSSGGVVTLCDAATGKALAQSPDPWGAVSGLTFTPDGGQLIAAAGGRWVSWDLTAATPDPRPVPLAEFTVLAPNGRVAVRPDTFVRADSPVEFVAPASGKRISRLDPPETADTVVISAADYRGGRFSGDGRRFVGFRRSERGPGGQQKELGLAVWDVPTGKRVARWPEGKPIATVAAVSPDGKAVAVLGVPATRLALWEPDSGRIRWERDLDVGVPFVAFTHGGAWLVVQQVQPPTPPGGIMALPPGAGPLFVLHAATGKEIVKSHGPILGPQPQVFADETFHSGRNARAVSPDGRAAAFSDFDGTIFLWELATDRERCRFAHSGPVHELAFSPDGRRLAAASSAAPVVVYDLYGRARASR
jgi:RNA polymerase sigma factor (sigma-70 family)